MKIQFHGAAGMVTGSCFLINCASKQFLVDCGMFQGSPEVKALNYSEPAFSATDIDFVLLTHAHIDHSGLLPRLVKQGFEGPIYATPATGALCQHLLPDSGRIQEGDVQNKNQRLSRAGQPLRKPLYTEDDAKAAVKRFQEIPLDRETTLAPGIKVIYRNAGHILGSAFLEVTLTEGEDTKKIVFSGDLGALDHPIIKDPDTFDETDFLVLESTYGDRNREPEDPEGRRAELARVILETCPAGGNVVIPGFAVGRTQDLLHDLLTLMEEDQIPGTHVWVDSPLASEVSKVFARFPGEYDQEANELLAGRRNLFDSPWLHFTRTQEESMALNGQTGIVIISASGMCDAGRIKHHLRHNLFKQINTVLFVGYQADGSLGRRLVDGARRVTIHGKEVAVKARIEQMQGYSGHADQSQLMAWAGAVHELRSQVFVVHGEDVARTTLAELLHEQLGFRAVVPKLGQEYDLLAPLDAPEVILHRPVPQGVAQPSVEPARPPRRTLAPRPAPPPPAHAGRADVHSIYEAFTRDLGNYLEQENDDSKRLELLSALWAELGRHRAL